MMAADERTPVARLRDRKALDVLRREWNVRLAREGLKVLEPRWERWYGPEAEIVAEMRLAEDDVDLDELEDRCEREFGAYWKYRPSHELMFRLVESRPTRHPRRFGGVDAHHARAERYGLLSTLTSKQVWTVFDAADGRCIYCEQPADALDHVEPMCAGGANAVWNVVPACTSCNSRKTYLQLDAWCEREGLRLASIQERIRALQERLVDVLGEDVMFGRGAS